ncbi:uncharacterized protein LOC132601605 [Lycium barbarum]|uniref:uncharacterized protein LOC132601605 n=1 Tax=Lycium barbarum TaxID=112863 RepID=UPI00293EE88B|nr:uncharacterized protein LOC132601605 [Lycium barbarum]
MDPTVIPVTVFQQNYDTWDGPPPPVPGAKLRLMCSYGGHIIPRLHDKSLFYVGGDTRIVVVDHQASLFDLLTRLSHSLLNGNKFTLKYQLPNEDLDSLVSVTTYQDLKHMIIETAASMDSLLDHDIKSGTWFIDVRNNADLLSRGLSDSAANVTQNVHSTKLDSPMVETASSLESSISSHSMGNTSPIAVKVEDNHTNATFQDQIIGLNEQFSHINVASNEQNPDEKTYHGAPNRLRKLILRQLSIQRKNGGNYNLPSPDSRRAGGNYNLPSPDSVASENIASAVSLSKHMICQDTTPVTSPENEFPFTIIDFKNNIMDPNSKTQRQQVQDSLAISSPQQNQQQQTQFIPVSAHYMQHIATGPVIGPSYYPIQAPPS